MNIIKKWFQLRRQRRRTLDILNEKFAQYPAAWALLETCWSVCTWCQERMFAIGKTKVDTTPAGEKFTFYCTPEAYVCLRCQRVSRMPDGYVDQVNVADWVPQ